MELIDYIEFNIDDKLRRIELYLGDITKLPQANKVDLLLVSAFPSNYAAVPGTLIAALENELKVSVNLLAKNKAEDLRVNFHCWISNELPKYLSFKRILCFEQGKKITDFAHLESPVALVGAVFRALFTAFRDQDFSILTPLLATGNQGSSKKIMIRAMVKACSSWIIAGMPLKCMKIVIYRGKEDSFIGMYDKEAIDEFSKLKAEMNWTPQTVKIIVIKTDIFSLFVKEDEESVELFLKIFAEILAGNNYTVKTRCIVESKEEKSYELMKVKFEKKMIQSKKVVLFLSPQFMKTPEAIEQYNLALCLSHKTRKNMLTPIYLSTIENIPEYMTLNQWIDCRLKNVEIKLEDRFRQGSETLLEIIKENDCEKILNENQSNSDTKTNVPMNTLKEPALQNFDIFISYSHKDSYLANMFLSFLNYFFPNLKIFFDKSGIKSGSSWQETLHYGVNNSKIVITLLSENYFLSAMCEEEFSLAISQHQSPQFSTNLIPLWISKKNLFSNENLVEPFTIKSYFIVHKIIVPKFDDPDMVSLDENLRYLSFYQEIITVFIIPILSGTRFRSLSSKMPITSLEEAALKARNDFFKSTWDFKQSFDILPIIKSDGYSRYNRFTNDVIIGFHEDDLFIADILKFHILKMKKGLHIKLSPMGPQSDGYKNMVDFENSNLIIILLNPYYISTKSCLIQLQIALSLHRRLAESGFRICPLILETLPSQPSYIHLLPCRFKADDELFQELINKFRRSAEMENIINYDNYNINNEKTVTMKTRMMLYLAASWIANVLFRDKYFWAPLTPAVYSSYDLVETNYGNQKLSDLNLINDQLELMKISKESLTLAEKFATDHPDIFAKITKTESHITGSKVNISNQLSKSKEVVETKVCSIL